MSANLTPSFRDGPKDQTRNLEIPGSRFARPGMTGQQSTHPEIIPLADFHAVMPENAVRGRGVEIEVRKRKAVEELLALERDGSVGPGGEGDVAAIRAFELRGLERLQIVAGLRKPLSQVFESLLGIGRRGHIAVGQSRAAFGGEIARQLDLPR